MRIELQQAYVLHSRPYRDTSLLIDFFTPDYGRVAAVARGVRQRKTRTRSLLNPFTRLLISLQGKSDLKLLTAVEADNYFFSLRGEQLYSGFYLNELLVRLLPEADAQEHLFATYQHSLLTLQQAGELEPVLRSFELELIQDLGYGLDFTHDALNGNPIKTDAEYCFDAQRGFSEVDDNRQVANGEFVVPGRAIIDIAVRNFSDNITRLYAKQLCRRMLKPLLGNRPLASRDLFMANAGGPSFPEAP